ncbi:MAG TPA: ATP-binding cassette domain-containing protein [Anaerolineaceae bacterium]|nr:ATP-binding cassette domain-containing protein [Anaerolineaceae bacterium]
MPEPHILIDNLSKTYRVPVRGEGLRAALKSLARPTYDEVQAVRGVTFSVQSGEMLGLIGPNGAGKTTTLKMLAGLLHPTSGEARVAGFRPWERHPDYLRRISLVMGNKSQMLWDIPPLDSFRVLAEIYSVPAAQLKVTLDELVALLEMEEVLKKPVRNLSLGERMKCELVASLLYHPAVLFLDEPTLGLDVSMQLRLRKFLAEYNRQAGVTVILTSHYMQDVMALCPRVVLIHHGRLVYDGELNALAAQLAPFKLLRVTLRREGNGNGEVELPPGVEVISREADSLTLRAPRADAPALTARLLQSLPVADLTVEDPPIEAVIDQIYREGESS